LSKISRSFLKVNKAQLAAMTSVKSFSTSLKKKGDDGSGVQSKEQFM